MGFVIKKASRQRAKMKIGMFGPSGSGKTMSALRLAHGLVGSWDKIVVIDTENESASLYSHLGEYSTLPLTAPFEPRRYNEAIKECEKAGFEVIIIDSISHEWEGVGGCLDIHSKMGGKFEHWSKVTPLHNAFISSIIQSQCHIITTGRSKIDYLIEGKSDRNPKGRVEKVGLKAITREGFDYELTVSFVINQEHYASTDKDRTDQFRDTTPFMITEETGKLIADWNSKGAYDPMKGLRESLIEKIRMKTQDYKNKELLESILSQMGITGSKEIIACSDELCLQEWNVIIEGLSGGDE